VRCDAAWSYTLNFSFLKERSVFVFSAKGKQDTNGRLRKLVARMFMGGHEDIEPRSGE